MSGTRAGQTYAIEGCDVFAYRDGLVARKDSYLDWLTYEHQTGSKVTMPSGRLVPPS
jgi:hypothetical protein